MAGALNGRDHVLGRHLARGDLSAAGQIDRQDQRVLRLAE